MAYLPRLSGALDPTIRAAVRLSIYTSVCLETYSPAYSPRLDPQLLASAITMATSLRQHRARLVLLVKALVGTWIIGFILLVLHALQSSATIDPIHPWWNGCYSHPPFAIPEEFDVPLNNSQWGERGVRLRLMGQWADRLVNNHRCGEDDDPRFETTLLNEFAFLNGSEPSIYLPWLARSSEIQDPSVGFVVCAGSKNYHMAAHLIRSLRRVHNSQTPIEIAYAGDDDLQPAHRDFLANLEPNVSFLDLLAEFPAAKADLVDGGWAMKPFAALASRHARTVLMDADAVFLTTPDALFGGTEPDPGLARTGALFHHDRAIKRGGHRKEWMEAQIRATGFPPSLHLSNHSRFLTGETWHEADSGVVALDKSIPSILLGLIFATWMNTKEVRDEVTYANFHGDKETFWIAMELSGVEYAFERWYAGNTGFFSKDVDPEDRVNICGLHMVHMSHSGETPFWINGGIYEKKNHPGEGFANISHYWEGEERPKWYFNGEALCVNTTGVKPVPPRVRRDIDFMQIHAAEVDRLIEDSGL